MGVYGINKEGHYDMYVKGMLFLNTLRHFINNDEIWWHTIKSMSDTVFRHKTIDYDQVVNFFEAQTKLSLKPFFDQYVKKSELPILEYNSKKTKHGNILRLRWVATPGFSIPVNVLTDGKKIRVDVHSSWSKVTVPSSYEFDQRTSYYKLRKVKSIRKKISE
jgi:aminopeptidase N